MQRTVPFQPGFRYGLGIARTEICGQTLWGHVGGVPGYETWSFTAADGSRQVTVTVNRSESLPGDTEAALPGVVAAAFC